MTYLYAKRIEGRVFLEIPESMASHLKIIDGGAVAATVEDDGVRVVSTDDRVRSQFAVAERIMAENEWVLSELAKSSAPRSSSA